MHQSAEEHHCIDIARGVAGQLAPVLIRIRPGPEVVAIVERSDRALEWQDLQSMPRQVELPDDLGPQQADHVREDRELEAWEDFLRYRGAAQHWTLLEHECL